MLVFIYNNFLELPFEEREINKLEDNIMRKDNIYELITKKYVYNLSAKDKLSKLAIHISKKDNTNTSWALYSYVYALNHQWKEAIESIENTIELEKWENIDSWMDLAHFLRKEKKYEKLSTYILLNLEKIIDKYAWTKNILKNLIKNS